jgi:hypothetical protein
VNVAQQQLAYMAFEAAFGLLFKSGKIPAITSIAEPVTSNNVNMYYPHLGAMPRMTIQDGRADETPPAVMSSFLLKNRRWASKVPILKLYFLADGANEAVQQAAQLLADAAVMWPVLPIFHVLNNVNDGGTAYTGYDGQPLFSTSHKDGGKPQNNTGTGTALSSYQSTTLAVAETAAGQDLAAAAMAMAKFTDNLGQVIYGIGPDTVLVPAATPSMFYAFTQLLKSGILLESPTWQGMIKRVIIDPYASAGVVRYLCTERAVKPVLWQTLQGVHINPPANWNGAVIDFEAEAYGAYGVGDWRCAYQLTSS